MNGLFFHDVERTKSEFVLVPFCSYSLTKEIRMSGPTYSILIQVTQTKMNPFLRVSLDIIICVRS
jgi:hypothetical protein